MRSRWKRLHYKEGIIWDSLIEFDLFFICKREGGSLTCNGQSCICVFVIIVIVQMVSIFPQSFAKVWHAMTKFTKLPTNHLSHQSMQMAWKRERFRILINKSMIKSRKYDTYVFTSSARNIPTRKDDRLLPIPFILCLFSELGQRESRGKLWKSEHLSSQIWDETMFEKKKQRKREWALVSLGVGFRGNGWRKCSLVDLGNTFDKYKRNTVEKSSLNICVTGH